MLRLILLITVCLISATHISAEININSECRFWNTSRGYAPFIFATPEGVNITNLTSSPSHDAVRLTRPSDNFTFTFRAANLSCHPSRKATFSTPDGHTHSRTMPEWSIFAVDTANDTTTFTIKTLEVADALSSSPTVSITVRDSRHNIIAQENRSSGLDIYDDFNTWSLSRTKGIITLSAGHISLTPIVEIPAEASVMTATVGFTASAGAQLMMTDISLCDNMPHPIMPHPVWSNQQTLRYHLESSSDPLEGWWLMFDRTLEESRLKPGGDYRLAIVRDEDDYLIIYISGAVRNASAWRPGTIKGVLKPDPFPGIYSLTWIDAEGLPLSSSLKAQEGEGNTLSLQFPYHDSVVRLRKVSTR